MSLFLIQIMKRTMSQKIKEKKKGKMKIPTFCRFIQIHNRFSSRLLLEKFWILKKNVSHVAAWFLIAVAKVLSAQKP